MTGNNARSSNEALHDAARRYLMDRHSELQVMSHEIRRWGVQSDELLLHPRIALLEAMLVVVEALIPTDVAETNFRGRVAEAGRTAEDEITRSQSWRQRGLWEATRPERDAFVVAVQSWSAAELSEVEALPYHRTILAEERAVLLGRLQERWKIGGNYWLPWSDAHLDEEAVVVDAAAFSKFVSAETLRDILRGGGVSHVFELWEHGEEQDYELRVEQFTVVSGWGERFWFSEAIDWIIYTTHEGSAALAGVWLLAAVKALWPTWVDHPYQPPRPVPSLQRTNADVAGHGPTDLRSRFELLVASGSGDVGKVASLLDSGVDVNLGWPQSGTALHAAAARGQSGSIRVLIERGADVDARAGMGVTPLMAGVSGGHVEVVRGLVAAGADVNAQAGASERDRRAGRTVLEIAEASPYLLALGGGRREAIIALLRNADAREE